MNLLYIAVIYFILLRISEQSKIVKSSYFQIILKSNQTRVKSLGRPLFPQLPLRPSCHLSPLPCLPCLWRDHSYPLESKHWAWACTMQELKSLLYWLTFALNCPSSSGRPVDRHRCSNRLSAHVWTRVWRSAEQSPHALTTKHKRSPNPCNLAISSSSPIPIISTLTAPWALGCGTAGLSSLGEDGGGDTLFLAGWVAYLLTYMILEYMIHVLILEYMIHDL